MSILQIEDKPNTSPTLIRMREKGGDFVYILDITILAVQLDNLSVPIGSITFSLLFHSITCNLCSQCGFY